MNVNDKTLQALATSLKFREMRNEVISSNLANSETPGYKDKVLDFEEVLGRSLDLDGQQSLVTTDPKHIKVGGGGFDNLEPEIYDDPNGEVSPDGNTVDPEVEVVRMNENKVMYDATIQLLNKKLGLIKYVLSNEK